GTDYLIVWLEDGEVMARSFSSSGTFIGDPMKIATEAEGVAAAWLGDQYLVAWSGAHAGAATITTSGIIASLGNVFGDDPVVGSLDIARGGGGALIAYGTQRPDGA